LLIVALVLAVIGLAALVTAVVTSNELIAWVCIAASVIGVVLLIVDALRERSRGGEDASSDAQAQDVDDEVVEDYPDETPAELEDETSTASTETVETSDSDDTAKVAEEDSNPR
jgi:membrane protein implicated in regulation of membrane protease activity